jgi:VanZ family protein
VGQQGVDLVVRLRRSEESFNGTPEFIVSNVFTDLGRHVLDISVKPGKLAISVDGTNRLTEKLPDDAFDTWVRDYRLAMGNEITFDRPWLGTIHQAMIDVKDKRVDYLVPGTLAIPETYYLQPHPDRMSLVPFYQEYYSVSIIQDWIVNFIGFVPLGLLVVLLYPNWSNVRRAAIICLGVSLVIETMQLYLPWRHPAIEDLILNMLGGACGAWLGVEYCKTRKCF